MLSTPLNRTCSFFFMSQPQGATDRLHNTEQTKERDVLFNDSLIIFYLRLYGVRHMVKYHSDSERGNLLPPHRLLFPISSMWVFCMHYSTDRIAYTTAFVTPVVEHSLEREIAQWVQHKGFIRRSIAL